MSDRENSRFARHYSLAEIGADGQARLSASRVELSGDPRAVDVARAYLERAGMTVEDGGVAIEVAEGASYEARAWFAGAFAATEAIKRALGVGTTAAIPPFPLEDP